MEREIFETHVMTRHEGSRTGMIIESRKFFVEPDGTVKATGWREFVRYEPLPSGRRGGKEVEALRQIIDAVERGKAVMIGDKYVVMDRATYDAKSVGRIDPTGELRKNIEDVKTCSTCANVDSCAHRGSPVGACYKQKKGGGDAQESQT